MKSLVDRLQRLLKVVPSGCWEFQGCKLKDGYGLIGRKRLDGKRAIDRTHRVMWEIVFGPIPEGLWVLHKCDNPPCCNPAHLFLGTQFDNMADMYAKGRGVNNVGEKNSNAKLTQEQVEVIRADDRLQRVIAAEYGVVKQTISWIQTGKTWKR